jgi:hypothetical protein
VDRARAATYLDPIRSPRSAGAYYPNALIALKASDPEYYEVNNGAALLADYFPDSVEWLEEFARMLRSNNPKDKQMVEIIAGRRYPTMQDPLEQQRELERFRAEVWAAYRKRVPVNPSERRIPNPWASPPEPPKPGSD